MESYYNCLWHPIYQKHENTRSYYYYYPEEFELALKVINRLRTAMTERSREAKRRIVLDKSRNPIIELYGIELHNEYHPSKYVESWHFVDTTDWHDWWLSPYESALIKKYGWTIVCNNSDADYVVSKL